MQFSLWVSHPKSEVPLWAPTYKAHGLGSTAKQTKRCYKLQFFFTQLHTLTSLQSLSYIPIPLRPLLVTSQ